MTLPKVSDCTTTYSIWIKFRNDLGSVCILYLYNVEKTLINNHYYERQTHIERRTYFSFNIIIKAATVKFRTLTIVFTNNTRTDDPQQTGILRRSRWKISWKTYTNHWKILLLTISTYNNPIPSIYILKNILWTHSFFETFSLWWIDIPTIQFTILMQILNRTSNIRMSFFF